MISVMRSLLAYGMWCCIVEIARRKVFPCNVCTADVQRSNTFSPKDALSYHVKGSRNVLICPRCADAATDWCKTAIFCKKSATNLGESWRFLVEQLVRFLEKTETIRNKRISRLELKDCVSKNKIGVGVWR